ncbi:ECF-type sigma factor [Novipirellula artificiosorum]|nr:ECF-type sigma factor [Novipirellula artificiosorum]
MSDVTQILRQIEDGDGHAAEKLLPVVYDELRKLAATRMASENPGQTLQPTALVHEAYIRLVDTQQAKHWDSRGHFFAAAAEAMRRILVDHARRKKRPKHGGDRYRLGIDAVENQQCATIAENDTDEVIAVNDVLDQLASENPQAAALVKLRYFAGMSLSEAAKAVGITPARAVRQWTYAKSYLYCELQSTRKF